jgi:hypothetical protein
MIDVVEEIEKGRVFGSIDEINATYKAFWPTYFNNMIPEVTETDNKPIVENKSGNVIQINFKGVKGESKK